MTTLRSQLNDNDFTVSKLYGFRSKREKTYYSSLSIDDFVIPDFNVSIKVKSKKDEVVDDTQKKYLKHLFTCWIIKPILLKRQLHRRKIKG